MADTPDPTDPIVFRMLPLVMLVAAVGMTAFLLIAFHGPGALVFGGLLILSVLGLILNWRQPRRGTVLLVGAVLVVASVGMAVFMFIAFRHNPTSLVFGMMMLLSTAAMTFGGLRRAGRDEDKVKR